MLNEIRSVKIQGASFSSSTMLPLFCEGTSSAKVTLLFGRNGSGKSTIARGFRKLKGQSVNGINSMAALSEMGAEIVLTDEEKEHIYVFDEDYINDNVRLKEDGLGSIVMLGEQAGLSELINSAEEELRAAEKDRDNKKNVFDEYCDPTNPKSPAYCLNRIHAVLQQDNGWAGRKRRIDDLKRNASVYDNAHLIFSNLAPEKGRDELIVDFEHEWEHLQAAKSGASIINVNVPGIASIFTSYSIENGNELIHKVIEHPELTEREQYLLGLVQSGHGEELKNTAREFQSSELTVCPKCHQTITAEYKKDLIDSIRRVLTDEVKHHQNKLGAFVLPNVDLRLEPFRALPSYQMCVDQIICINLIIDTNNVLLRSKINDPYTPVERDLIPIREEIEKLAAYLRQLNREIIDYNRSVTETTSIKERLTSINNQIAHWDVIELSNKHETLLHEKQRSEEEYNKAVQHCNEKREELAALNARRNSINIAIDVINEGLKYIFFSDNRMQIQVDGNTYRIYSNGQPVKPQEVSVGERNIIGMCYFFADLLRGKSREKAYEDEYLIIVDDPISSFDHDNKIGILSYLKFELRKVLCGNVNSRALVMTHDLFTAIDCGRMFPELIKECKHHFVGHGDFMYSPQELNQHRIIRFANNRNEYTNLLKIIYEYANGGQDDQEVYIGNIIRQVLEAFSSFEYKKSIDEVLVDETILSGMEKEEHRKYYRNLMSRLVLNEGSHRYDQVRNMQLDFLPFISETNKRRTAKDIICFMELLNAPHIKAHLGDTAESVIVSWCDQIGYH